MANHVNSVIEFHKINEAASKKLVEMVGRCREMDYGRRWFADIFVEGELTFDDVEKYQWTTEHVGPKWCYIEEFDEDSLMMITESAWSPPEQGVMKLVEELNKLDEKIVWSIKYEDEMPNFIGAYVYENDDVIDGAEDDDEEIRDMMFYRYPNLKEHWDEENDEWQCNEDGEMTDEAYEAEEEYRDTLYEWISERQDDLVYGTLKDMDEPAQD